MYQNKVFKHLKLQQKWVKWTYFTMSTNVNGSCLKSTPHSPLKRASHVRALEEAPAPREAPWRTGQRRWSPNGSNEKMMKMQHATNLIRPYIRFRSALFYIHPTIITPQKLFEEKAWKSQQHPLWQVDQPDSLGAPPAESLLRRMPHLSTCSEWSGNSK